MHQGCGFEPLSGHIQGSTSERIGGWNSRSMFLSLFLSLSKINTQKLKKKRNMNLLTKD